MTFNETRHSIAGCPAVTCLAGGDVLVISLLERVDGGFDRRRRRRKRRRRVLLGRESAEVAAAGRDDDSPA